jgi:acyl-CoA synthetase (AMP-forming)/AMP-acid ligase II
MFRQLIGQSVKQSLRFQKKSLVGKWDVKSYTRQLSTKISAPSIITDRIVEYEFETIVEMFEKSSDIYPLNNLFGTKFGNEFKWTTFNQFHEMVQNFKKVLVHHNIGKGDKVSIICNNCVEWAVAMYAVLALGGVWVPMYVFYIQSLPYMSKCSHMCLLEFLYAYTA